MLLRLRAIELTVVNNCLGAARLAGGLLMAVKRCKHGR